MKVLTVILGAGASYDCAGIGQDVNNEFRPPLARQLFGPKKRSADILHNYPGAEALSDEIRGRMAHDSLEEILADLYSKSSEARQRQLIQIPFYLRDVLTDCSRYYMRRGASCYNTLVNAIEDSDYEKILYVTLNYDTLLDKALRALYVGDSNMGDRSLFPNIEGYIDLRRRWSLVKLHGSVDWARPVYNNIPNSLNLNLSSDILKAEGPLQFGNYECLHLGWGGRGRKGKLFYPSIIVPSDNKTGFACPSEQVTFFREFVSECTDFLFIGFSGNDAHVLKLIDPVNTVQRLWIVNGSWRNGLGLYNRLCAAQPAFAAIPPRNSILNIGFSEFTTPSRITKFPSQISGRGLKIGLRKFWALISSAISDF